MIIILKKIPAHTRSQEIEDFVRPAIKGGLFSKSGRIESISILVQQDAQTHEIEYHGLVRIMPDDIAKRAIKKLNRKRLNGRHIAVFEYQHRRWQNDRRIRNQNEELRNKRLSDRRRRYLEVQKDISEQFSSEKRFNRKLD